MSLRPQCSFVLSSRLFPRSLTREQVLQFQDRALRRVVAHAYENVPYYRRLFKRYGIHPGDIRSVRDLPSIPITRKNDLRAVAVRDTLAEGMDPGRLFAVRTSGFTGEPFTIRRTWLEQRLLLTLWLRAHHYYGLRVTDRRVSVARVHHGLRRSRALHKRVLRGAGLYRHVCVDCGQPRAGIVRTLRRLRPDFLAGYPGALSHVSEAISRQDQRYIRPRAVEVGGEVLTEPMRTQMSEAFRAPVYNCYGSHEFSLIAWECRQTGQLHTCDESMIVEVLKDGRQAAPGEQGELVGTSLTSFAMPLIRYGLGDIVTRGAELCRCGLPFSTLGAVQGRKIDYLPLPDGRWVHPYQIVDLFIDTCRWFNRYQLVQERLDRVALRVVPYGRPAEDQVRQLEHAVAQVLGPQVDFTLELVTQIAPQATGKYRVSHSLVASRYEDGVGDGSDAQRRLPGISIGREDI